MGIAVLVYGKSGSGKSDSLKNFGSEDIILVNCVGKPLPFRGKFKRTINTTNIATLDAVFAKAVESNVPSIVIDDAGYIMTELFMRGHRSKAGASSFELYNDIGDTYWNLFEKIRKLPENIIVYIVMHESSNDYGEVKLRTIGKLLDDKVCIEGLCTICIHAVSDAGGHRFRVQAGNGDIAKSPEGMFESDEIPNDLKAVDEAIREYYEIKREVKSND